MKILLIQSHLGRIKYFPPVYPIGLAYIATAIKAHEVKIFDMNFWEFEESLDRMNKAIENFKPDVVGVSIRNIDTTQRFDLFLHFKTIPETAKLIKKHDPEIKLIFGGSGFSLFPREIMERVPEIDYGVYMEGEDTIQELLDNLDSPGKVKGLYYRENRAIQYTGHRSPPDFSALPVPRRDSDLIDIEEYIDDGPIYNIGIQSKRGCVLECGYCNYPFLSGKKLRLRTPEHVVDEIEYLMNMGVKKFVFLDNVFNVPVSHAEQICEEIIRRNLKPDWNAWMEMKRTSEKLVRLMRDAGCRGVGFSPDGATDKTLGALRKGITVADIEKTIDIIRKVKGVRAGYNFFCMYPGMGFFDLVKTIYYYFKIPLVLFGRGSTFMGWVRIEPHTDLYKLSLDEGYITPETNLLPEDEKEMAELFYYKKWYKLIDYSIIYFSQFMENKLKPFAKGILRREKRRSKWS